jgi:hypothetical protein
VIHRLTIVFALFALTACSQGAPQSAELCPAPAQPAELVPVSWPQAVYWPRPGVEHHADVLSVASDGAAELLITGLDDTEGPGHPTAITVVAPCLAWAGKRALRRPGDMAWAFPSVAPADARAGVLAESVGDMLRVAVRGAKGVAVLKLPELHKPEKGYPLYVLDPSLPLAGDAPAAWASACRAP